MRKDKAINDLERSTLKEEVSWAEIEGFVAQKG